MVPQDKLASAIMSSGGQLRQKMYQARVFSERVRDLDQELFKVRMSPVSAIAPMSTDELGCCAEPGTVSGPHIVGRRQRAGTQRGWPKSAGQGMLKLLCQSWKRFMLFRFVQAVFVSRFVNLRLLNVSSNTITDLTQSGLSACTALTELDASDNCLFGEGTFPYLAFLPSLQKLKLGGNSDLIADEAYRYGRTPVTFASRVSAH